MRAIRLICLAGVIAFVATSLALCSAQEPMPDELQVRAAIVVNLVRFITFKSNRDEMHGPLHICLLGYDQQSSALENYLSAHSVDGRPFQVRRVSSSERFDECQVLYMSSTERHHFDGLYASLIEAGVLTISDDPAFATSGGIIGLPVIGDRIEIQINLACAEQSGIAISSRLLGVAKVIRKVAGK
ncbi:YfiR family protein [Occallatibacter savannae]|uniref:YfiR family protein n=1 Tax=Occallatibacter savannae TaxID=1002691 RepID=UPI000D6970C0|nr:YfiR family protein [Occallatibacter savannae]